jgi:glutathione synthase/RimK-type ligase-like ATP-grasp enzyme
LAVRAVEAIGADYSGVDVIEGADEQFYVLETNELPGFGTATGQQLGRYIL